MSAYRSNGNGISTDEHAFGLSRDFFERLLQV